VAGAAAPRDNRAERGHPVKPSEAPTVKAKRTPVILVVGFPAAFVSRCADVAVDTHATVVGVDAGAESAFAMQTIPIVVVMRTEAVPTSPLGTIARDLGIELVTIADEKVGDARLKEQILAALAASQHRTKPIA
jgi:hypothetical protein